MPSSSSIRATPGWPSEPRGVLREFNVAGVLDAADVHVATRLGALAGETDEDVLLAVALAVRAPRLAHVCVDLAGVRESATSELDEPVDLHDLPWPDVEEWVRRLEASPLVAVGASAPPEPRPLRLEGTRLYLDRYWRQECSIADGLSARAAHAPTVDDDVLATGLDQLFGSDGDDLQRAAASAAVRSAFSVVAGGPGTGKTTTVARIVVLLDQQATAAGRPLPRVALAAPTGKAAARLEEAVHAEAANLDVPAATKQRLLALSAVTLHRLLGWRPGNRSRFRHDSSNRLPFDVVIVDETSMVSTSMMAKLVEAIGTDARLILVGDPDQLASVEAGAVLGDIVGPAGDDTVPAPTSPISDGIVVLRRVHRFGGAIAELAAAIRHGDVDATLAVLRAGHPDVEWIETDAERRLTRPHRSGPSETGSSTPAAASRLPPRAGDAAAALDALGAMRVLCAHRRGPYGVTGWTARIERWLAESIDGYAADGVWYIGRPLLVTANDYALRLYNGDTGVIVRSPDHGVVAAFQRGSTTVEISPRRISAVDTVHAMTIHKSQGSQFDRRRRRAPRPDVADPDAGAAVHGGDAGAAAPHWWSAARRASAPPSPDRSPGRPVCATGCGPTPDRERQRATPPGPRPRRAATVAGATRLNPTTARLRPTYSRRSVTSSAATSTTKSNSRPFTRCTVSHTIECSPRCSHEPKPIDAAEPVAHSARRGRDEHPWGLVALGFDVVDLLADELDRRVVGRSPRANARRATPGRRAVSRRRGGGGGSRRCRTCCGSCPPARSGSTSRRACRDRSHAGTRPGRRRPAASGDEARADRSAARAGPATPD